MGNNYPPNFFSMFGSKQSNESSECSTSFRDPCATIVQPRDYWLDEASNTGQVFPGNLILRPYVSFGLSFRKENVQSCRKRYRKSENYLLGIFTLQCECRHPKLIALSVMDECESVSTAMSVLLSRFKNLPQATYYDNGCNLAKSVLLRFP